MRRIVIAMSALALVTGAGGILSQEPALADEANLEEAYKPPKHEPEINETENVKKIAPSKRKRAMKAKMKHTDIFAGTREEILDTLKQSLKPGDWVLIKGSRGARMDTIVKGYKDWAGIKED